MRAGGIRVRLRADSPSINQAPQQPVSAGNISRGTLQSVGDGPAIGRPVNIRATPPIVMDVRDLERNLLQQAQAQAGPFRPGQAYLDEQNFCDPSILRMGIPTGSLARPPGPPRARGPVSNAIREDGFRGFDPGPEDEVPLVSRPTPLQQVKPKTDAKTRSPTGAPQPADEHHEKKEKQGKVIPEFVATMRPSRKYLEQLDHEMRTLYLSLIPTNADHLKRSRVLDSATEWFREVWPSVRLLPYGSATNALGFRNADVDVCFVSEQLKHTSIQDQPELVEEVAEILKRRGMVDVLALPKARVPVVKFRHPNYRLACDICFNNKLALENTRLLQTYVFTDRRFAMLALCIKYWAKNRKINEPYTGTLSSYAYVVLLIHFLQTRNPPVLPNLQEITRNLNRPSLMCEGFDCRFWDDMGHLSDAVAISGSKYVEGANRSSVAELLFEFFRYYGYEFDFHESVVCIRQSQPLTKEEKEWTIDAAKAAKQKESENAPSDEDAEDEHEKEATSHGPKDRFWFCIEDPFETSHNLGRPVGKNSLYDIRGELMRGYRMICKGTPFRILCKEYDEGSPHEKPRKSRRDREKGDKSEKNEEKKTDRAGDEIENTEMEQLTKEVSVLDVNSNNVMNSTVQTECHQ